MHEINMKFRAIYLMMFLVGLNYSQAFAAPLRDRVLRDVSITQSEQHIIIKVAFNFPVQYVRHYPIDYGQELNIQLKPILAGIADLSGLKNRESLSAPDNNPAGLVLIQYEGNELLNPTIRVVLDKARSYEAKQGDDFRSLIILLPVETGEQGGEGEADEEIIDQQQPGMLSPQKQEDLLKKGVGMMDTKEYMRAILIYTKLLDSTDIKVREFSQFQLATAQEYKGHLAHARAEYKNYLKTYPGGENADQARQRLNALMSDRPGGLGSVGDVPGKDDSQWAHDYYGGISVYYERDESLYQEEEDIENLSSLMTGFDATWRAESDKYMTEAVAIGSYELSLLDSNDNRVRISRLHIDFGDTAETITSRLGRQSSSKGGVLTRFDGARVGYLVTDKIRLNVVAGFPVNLPYDGLETDKYFYGINFDLGRFADHWDFNTYFINQISDGIDDRRAVGGEVRFIGENASLYSLLDYDILYDDITVFLLTGNYLLPNKKTRINFQADFRGVPILSTSNALIGQVSPSLEALEDFIGEDELRRLASDRTLDSSFATLGMSQPLTDSIQIAGDISWSKIDGAPASGGVEAFESTGDDFYYSLQLIGSGMIKRGDVSSVGLRYVDTFYRDTYTFKLNSSYPLYDTFRISPRIQVDYRENKLRTGEQWRLIPGLRLEYIFGRTWRFEIDGEYRYADKELEGIADGKDGYAVALGFRKDF